jgi:predicted transcriptional regulator
MKITIKTSALFLIFISMISCSELDKLTEFDITKNFSTSINVSASEANSFSESTIIDISSNEEIKKNLDLIQNITINSLTFKIDDFSGADNTIVTQASISIGSFNISISDINLKQSLDDSTVYEISNSTELNAIATLLKNSHSVTIVLSGEVSNIPTNFKVTLNLDTTVTVDVI